MIATLYTYKITKGKFKGRIVKSWDSNTFIYGITPSQVPCFDEEGNEYVIHFDELKLVEETDYEVSDNA